MNNLFSYNASKYSYLHYAIAIAAGMLCGGLYIPVQIVVLVYVLLGALLIFFAAVNDLTRVFSWMPYLCYLEIWVKDKAPSALPYSFAQFVMIAIFLALIIKQLPQIHFHTRLFVLTLLFAIIELMNAVGSTYIEYARFLIYNSFYVALIVIWSSINVITPDLLRRFIYNLKVAGIFLCGIIVVAHVNGEITYELHSNLQSTNGLAPNQVACYLGITAVLFFLSIMSNDDILSLAINIVLMIFCTTLLALSFSRGGIYILGGVMGLYFLINIHKPKTLLFSLILVPVTYVIYQYTTVATGGAIEERFAMAGTSGRDVLAEAALTLFKKNIYTGMGTGNFFRGVVGEHLFRFSSGAHNEFTRVMAEHGLMGMIPYYSFYLVCFVNILKRRQGLAREIGIYFFTLFFLITIYNALKISIQPLLLIFAIATPVIQEATAEETVEEDAGADHVLQPSNAGQ